MACTGTIIFDLDGTLHLTEAALVPAIQMAMTDLGVRPASPEAINALYGEPLEEFCRVLLGGGGRSCEEFRLGIRKHQKITLPKSGALYPGTCEMLEELRYMGFGLAVCSNAGLDYIRLVTGSLGIGRLFGMMVGQDGMASKTARVRDIIRNTGNCFTVMVGDRYHDIRAARENGIPSIGCLYGYGSSGEMEPADRTVAAPSGIPPAVRELMQTRAVGTGFTPVP